MFDFSKNTVNAKDGTTRIIPFDSETQTTEGIVSEIWSAKALKLLQTEQCACEN